MAYAVCPIDLLFATGARGRLHIGDVDCHEAPELRHVGRQCHYVWRAGAADEATGRLVAALRLADDVPLRFTGGDGVDRALALDTNDECAVLLQRDGDGQVTEVHIVTGLTPAHSVPRRWVRTDGVVGVERSTRDVDGVAEITGPQVTDVRGWFGRTSKVEGPPVLLALVGTPAALEAWRVQNPDQPFGAPPRTPAA